MRKLRNLYRDGLNEEIFLAANIQSNWGLLKVIGEEDISEKNGGLILTAGSMENKMGVLFFELVNAGDNFCRTWNARQGDIFLISHLAGDKIGKFVFVESQDVLLKYGDNIWKE